MKPLFLAAALLLSGCGGSSYDATAPGYPVASPLFAVCLDHDVTGKCKNWSAKGEGCRNPFAPSPPIIPCEKMGKFKE